MTGGRRGPLPKPRYRGKPADRWEVKVDGRYVPIVDEYGSFIRGDNRNSELKATECWHLYLKREQAKVKGGDNLVAVVLDKYLEEMQRLRPQRYRAAARTLQSFDSQFPDLIVNELTERHIDEWFAAHPEWDSPSTRKTHLGTLTAAFNWASKMRGGCRLIPFDHPLRGMDLDQLQHKAYHRRRSSRTGVRDQVHLFLMHNVPDDFGQVLFALRHSGTRPGNVCKVTAEMFFDTPGVLVFEEESAQDGQTVHKTYDATHEVLAVPLTGELVALCKQLSEKYPTGPLFRKADGEPWTAKEVSDRFYDHRTRFQRMGVPIPDVTFAYAYRHETSTTLIAGGETDAMTAAVLGHKGTRTLHEHYNHVLARLPERVSALRRHVQALPGELEALRAGGVDLEPHAGEERERAAVGAEAAPEAAQPPEQEAASSP